MSGTFSCCHLHETGWVRGGVDSVVTVDVSEGYVYALETSSAPVGCISMVAGEAVGPAVHTSRCGAALASSVSKVSVLAAQD